MKNENISIDKDRDLFHNAIEFQTLFNTHAYYTLHLHQKNKKTKQNTQLTERANVLYYQYYHYHIHTIYNTQNLSTEEYILSKRNREKQAHLEN